MKTYKIYTYLVVKEVYISEFRNRYLLTKSAINSFVSTLEEDVINKF